MRITDLLDKSSIRLNAAATNKKEALDAAIDLMASSGKILDVEEYRKLVYAREEEGTTGIGEGIAIPHGKGDCVATPGLAAMVIPRGVDFDALDGAPTDIIFLIAAPNTKDNVHLDVLSKLSVLLMDEQFTNDLRIAKSAGDFLRIINKAEAAKDRADDAEAQSVSAGTCKILAVTACPTGIAHTYMAAEALEKKATAVGCEIKVETRGSGGAKNILTSEEIEAADCIIVAADTKVPMERFHGKKLIECQVSDGINKADQLIARAMQGDAPVYHAKEGAVQSQPDNATGGVGHRIYKHLMNGVSHMLPFVVGGGILIAIAFLIDSVLVNMATATPEMRQAFGTITPYAAFFKQIGGASFGFMLPILAGFIAMSIADRPGLALGFVGGAIAANGTSGFLGALVAGFLAGYVIIFLKKVFSGLPSALDGIKPILLYPLLGILIVGVVMIFVVEPPIGALNIMMHDGLKSMDGTKRIVLGLILGGMMSVDLGGPVNKAAYVFGAASIAQGNYHIMAAVMVGGMVPPCAVALSTLLFKDKFTKEERKSGPTNFIMGLSFISEGAIPFAASDPLRVLPSCIIGSAVSGALSTAFNCTLMAPHGGIFVFPVVGNAPMYLVSLAVGTIIAAVLMGLLKKRVQE